MSGHGPWEQCARTCKMSNLKMPWYVAKRRKPLRCRQNHGETSLERCKAFRKVLMRAQCLYRCHTSCRTTRVASQNKKNKILYLNKICRSVICRSVIRQILVASWHVRTYTSVFRILPALESGSLGQLVGRETLNLKIAGSIPRVGLSFFALLL